jgi:hypothetical protein
MSAPVASPKPGFDPSQYVTRVGGSDYLPIKWCLVWLRDEHPDATIETQLIDHVDNVAIFRAEVRVPTGGCATGYGSESAGDFRDYLEKAETKAIGRALRALGYGAQFSTDHEVGPGSAAHITDISARRDKDDDELASAGQITHLRALAGKLGIEATELDARAISEFGLPVQALSRGQATQLRELIRGAPGGPPKPPSSARPESPNGRRATELPGVATIRGSAGNDPNTR